MGEKLITHYVKDIGPCADGNYHTQTTKAAAGGEMFWPLTTSVVCVR